MLGERVEAVAGPVDRVDLGKCVDQLVGRAPPLVGVVERRGHLVRDHVSLEEGHHVEGSADDTLVVADGQHVRSGHFGLL